VVRALKEWGFESDDLGRLWEGKVAGGDRLRFFGMLSRYSGLFQSVRLEDPEREVPEA
jgi:ABC-2 type transport system ATP-binding protein